jgi:DMSO/TMAO reductase YedYZ molybdopterin-dependent catalytic subunit
MFKKISVILMVLVVAALAGCSGDDSVKKLQASEVKAYEGENLSSIVALKDNAIKGTQKIDISKYKLKIDGLVSNPQELTYDEVLANTKYSKVVTLHCVEGWSAKLLWEGVKLEDLFSNAKVGEKADTVIFYASDGYSTALPLKVVIDKNMLLAYKINGVVLPYEKGYPFMLVAEDKLGYKWIKWITRIELSADKEYKGYWEQRGYPD